MNRYHRQTLLSCFGVAGQSKLAASRVLLVGCGALGTTLADQLVRAGVGHLRIVDRDLVEWTNLQRQVLFDETDARDETPKAVAAAKRLRAINSEAHIEAVVADVGSTNIERLALEEERFDLLLDGTDNAATRYLLNDVAIKYGIPWVYGGCVGTEGRVLAILPNETPCLRCLFPEPPTAGETQTCDTAGILGPAAAIVASLQSVAAIKILIDKRSDVVRQLVRFDVWSDQWRSLSTVDARDPDCPTCGHHRYEFLDGRDGAPQTLCGRNAVQFRAAGSNRIDLDQLAAKLDGTGTLRRTSYLLRYQPTAEPAELTIFGDGRVIVHGTGDITRAKSLYSRYLGG